MSIEPERQVANRRNLAAALRELRVAAGLSGERLAARCAMSQAKISRIETGKILATVVDVERILKALGVPEDLANEMLALARAANVDYTSQRASARIGLWRRQAELKALEESASVVRHFLPAIPTGLLQMPEYAREVITPKLRGMPVTDVERILAGRRGRQSILDDDSRRFVFLMTEQAVRWRISGNDVMAKQVLHMANVAAKPGVDIAIIPRRTEVGDAPMHVFVIYDERLVTVELFSGTVAFRDPRDVSYYLNLFEFFLGHALTGDDAISFLHGVAREFM